ncbi:MAG: hypothetical protein HZB68_04950, partial [Candidatus Aenigmarchaeota archaeon]|nr:hypothetical protein [Candidatus Aenigmarchaeota archaeon]
METRDAIATAAKLAKKLAEKGYVNILDEGSMDDVLKNAKYKSAVKIDGKMKPITHKVYESAENFDMEKEYQEIGKKAAAVGANYAFVEKTTHIVDGKVLSIMEAQPYAVLGDDEIDLLSSAGPFPYDLFSAAKNHLRLSLEVDYMELYASNPTAFKDHFRASTDAKRVDIIKSVMDTDSKNDDVDKWLGTNYSVLMKKAM